MKNILNFLILISFLKKEMKNKFQNIRNHEQLFINNMKFTQLNYRLISLKLVKYEKEMEKCEYMLHNHIE